jgi:hypothetical protein
MKKYKVLEINITGGEIESVGEITLEDTETKEIMVNTIWYSDDGEHCFCYDVGETDYDGNEILSDMLIRHVSVGDIID